MAKSKWIMSMPGAKSRIFHEIWPYIPPPPSGVFVVPFFGTGFDSAFMAHESFGVVAGDASELLVEMHKDFFWTVRLAQVWLDSDGGDIDKPQFRALRASHNANPQAWSLYLLGKLAHGQLIRHNRKGDYNADFGQVRALPSMQRARDHEIFVRSIELTAQSFELTLAQAQPGDVVYLDPPYLGTFDAYTARPFDSEALAAALADLTARGIAWAASNSPVFEAMLRAQPGIRDSELKVESFNRQGTISAGSRAKASEILITWVPS